MTKAELIKAMKDMPDDAKVYLYSGDFPEYLDLQSVVFKELNCNPEYNDDEEEKTIEAICLSYD